MKILVWQWGRRGAGPRVALELARGLAAVPGTEIALSLSTSAELLAGANPPHNDLPIQTYSGSPGFLARLLIAPLTIAQLARRLRALRPDLALCAMPGPFDLVMAAALRRARVPFAVIVHDAEVHPGDGLPLQMTLQRALLRRAQALVALSTHVADRLVAQGAVGHRPLLRTTLPPLAFGPAPPPLAHGGPLRLLSFGRLLPYKGLDLLADALAALGPQPNLTTRLAGQGPPSADLDRLAALPNVTVENRWIPEPDLAALLAWSDALILPYREASQSGVAAAAIAARRWVIATNVGGLAEQLANEPLARLCPPTAAGLAAALRDLLANVHIAPPSFDPHLAWQNTAARLAADLRKLCL